MGSSTTYRNRRPEVAVVTGATAGVGRATVRELAGSGTRKIALLARGSAGPAAAAEDVRAAGAVALPIETDVADYDQVEAAADRVTAQPGPIDLWINDGFSAVFAPFTEIESAEFRRATEVTYLGFVYGTRAVLDRMLSRDHDTIVQVGSALAHRSIPLQSAYCGAKHAIVGFTESLRCELLRCGTRVRVTQVHLPALNTPQFGWVLSRLERQPQPVPPIYQPEVAARAIFHAAHQPRREYWVGTSTVATILANRIVPGLLDHYLARTGYCSQQTSKPTGPHRSANPWHPVGSAEGHDFGAHGSFDRRSHRRSPQVWASQHRILLVAAAGVLGAAGAAARLLTRP
ncbi:SDR family oxidoreductase [Plantactinospora sp. KLBMP9567]|uniref:SDR family oxidoreductase n=1 Tax=Plantactinospora sp. KLBMP9567 TaxID=3085900 RepID=UPI002981ABFB|nr:SDR family oxidoreductase [Plantactinospora sp. KLBMP9567]MDW5328912.1 SDR family oxidoreductase [Plantactinospora sp. KLBMP9567]